MTKPGKNPCEKRREKSLCLIIQNAVFERIVPETAIFLHDGRSRRLPLSQPPAVPVGMRDQGRLTMQ
ncbi:hypothetical protein B5E84_18575 [Lachnoclostridium sp. An14]|nr:hypothetical protein B5E84_18575 [Lachnoclostridium sp. An14]